MNSLKISIILPVYNVAKYLDRCMESLLNQTLRDIEIIIVDDGSPDNCPTMCDDYAKKDVRVKVIHKKNEGLGMARNSGLDVARGEYVAFVDSDDFVELNMYASLYKKAVQEGGCDAVYCGFRTEMMPGKWIDSNEVCKDEVWNGEEVQRFMFDMIASEAGDKAERHYQMSVWHSIYKRSVIEANKIRFVSEREVSSEDIPFQVDFLCKANKVAYLGGSFYYYCLNGTSLTATLKLEKYERYKKLRSCLLEKSSNLEYHNRVNRLFIGYTRSFLYDIVNSNWKNKKVIIRNIHNDSVWKVLKKEYSPNNLPFVSRSVYNLLLSSSYFLLFWVKFLNVIKKILNRSRSF